MDTKDWKDGWNWKLHGQFKLPYIPTRNTKSTDAITTELVKWY